MKKSTLTEDKAEKTPTGGVLVGKRQGQTIIHNKGTLSGYLVGKTHAEGGIKAVNKSTGQPLEMQGGEVVITAPAVSDTTKRNFDGKMMTNREILSTINERGGGVAFAKDGMEIPKKIKRTGASYKYGGKTMTDHEIYKHITKGHLADGMTLPQIAKMHKVSVKELQKQVDMGMKAESEHTSSKREQMKIVKDHLYENPKYYSLLKKAGLKHGGAVRRSSLVRDAKKGNTPARDLNNYNDILDMDADGIVGAETGLYDDGGSVKELVEYITIGNQSSNPYMDLEKVRFYNFIDFKIFIKDLYANATAGNKREIFLCINRDDSTAKFRVSVSQGKNTNSNFNPFTGTFKDLEKNLQKFSVGNFDLFDWNRWGGVKTAKTTPSQTKKPLDLINKKIWIGNNPDLSRRVQELGFANGFENSAGKSVVNTSNANIFFVEKANGTKYMYIFDYSKDAFDKETEIEIFEADLFPSATPTAIVSQTTPLTKKLFENTKIKINSDYDLAKKVVQKLEEIGFTDTDAIKRLIADKDVINSIWVSTGKYVGWMTDDNDFNNSNKMEIFADDLQIDTATASVKKSLVTGQNLPLIPDIDYNFSGLIKDLPDPIKRLALTRQVDGGKSANEELFINDSFNDGNFMWTDTPEGSDFWESIYQGNFERFKKIYGEYGEGFSGVITATPTSTKTSTITNNVLSKDELFDSKIWIGDDVVLRDRVLEKLNELGIPRDADYGSVNYDKDVYISIYTNDFVIWSESKVNFDKDPRKEIFADNLFPNATALPTIDLTNTKIWIGTNPALSEKIQKRAFELGWDWGDKPVKLKYTTSPSLFFLENNRLAYADKDKNWFDNESEREIFESDLFPTSKSSKTSKQTTPVAEEDWVKKFTADLDKLVVQQNDPDFSKALSKEHKDLDALIKLLPSFQQSKYAIERARILNEIKKLHNKLTYEGFIKPNEALSSDANLFTPQGLLDYYFTQSTQNPTAELEPACELPTPNGKKSKLPLSAYLNVRTPQFKNWFGDWEKAYETGNYVDCSKMIDPDTKEPKIYFHGVRKYVPNFGQFSNMGQGVVRPYGAFEPPSFPASYFAGEEDYAKFYGGVAENMPTPSADYKPFIYKVFLSVKNPISLLPLDFMLSYKDFMDYIYVGYGVKVDPNQELLKQLNNDMTKKNPMWIYVRRDIGFIEKLKDFGYDALFQMGDIPKFLPNGEVEPDRTKHLQEIEYLTFYPSQVKSATVKKSFYFDFFNDIRFKNGGYVRI
jgi:archaellin